MFTISLQVRVKEEFKETGVLEENPSWVGKLWLATQTLTFLPYWCQNPNLGNECAYFLYSTLSSLCLRQDFWPRVESLCVCLELPHLKWANKDLDGSFPSRNHGLSYSQLTASLLKSTLPLIFWESKYDERKDSFYWCVNSSHLDIMTAYWNKWAGLYS